MANLVPQAPDEDFGDYHVLGVLGNGSMGRLYLAEKRGVVGDRRIVALRSLDPLQTNGSRIEKSLPAAAAIASRLDHPNIEATYELGELGGRQFLSAEYLAGESLGMILTVGTSRSRMPTPIATLVIRQCIGALRYAHEFRDDRGAPAGLVHQDIRPGNIFVCYDGAVKVFGCSAGLLVKDIAAIRGGSQDGWAFSAPEQLDHGTIDARTDLFSAGIVLWECLTGKRLFGAESAAKSMEAVRSRYVEPPSVFNSEVPPGLDEIVLTALSRDPRRRYQTAQEMFDALEGVLARFDPQPTTVDVANWLQGLFGGERAALKHQIKEGIGPEVALARLQRLNVIAGGNTKRSDEVGPGGARRSPVRAVVPTASNDTKAREPRAPGQLGVRPPPHALPAPAPHTPSAPALHAPPAPAPHAPPAPAPLHAPPAPAPLHAPSAPSVTRPATLRPFEAGGEAPSPRTSPPSPIAIATPIPIRHRPVAPPRAAVEAAGPLLGVSLPSPAPVPSRQGAGGRRSLFIMIGVGVAVVAAVGIAVLAVRRGGTDASIPQPEAPQVGALQIQTNPPGAQVLIDGDPSGLATPGRIGGLRAGRKVEIRVLKSGYKPLSQVTEILSGVTKSLSFSLEESMGTIRLQGVPPDSTTYVDDVVVDFRKPLLLPVGPHRLRVELADRLLSSMNLDVKAGDHPVHIRTLDRGGR